MANVYLSIEDLKPTDDYAELCHQLAIINAEPVKPPKIYDPDKSYLTRYKNLFIQDSPTRGNERYYYGVILEVRDVIKPHNIKSFVEVFVDVPGFNGKKIVHPDIFADPKIKLDDYEDLIFYQIDTYENRSALPVEGGIAIVKISKHYPNHRSVDKYGNIFVGMIHSKPYIQPTKNTDRLTFKGTGGFPWLGYGVPFFGAFGGSSSTGMPSRKLTEQEVNTLIEAFPKATFIHILDDNDGTSTNYFQAARSAFERSMKNIKWDSDSACLALAAEELGISVDVVIAQIMAESNFGGGAVSEVGAQGLVQMMPSTLNFYLKNGEETEDEKKIKIKGKTFTQWVSNLLGYKEYVNKTETKKDSDGNTIRATYNVPDLANPANRCASVYACVFMMIHQIQQASNQGFNTSTTNPDVALAASMYNGGAAKTAYFKRFRGKGEQLNYKGPSDSDIRWFTGNASEENRGHILKLLYLYQMIQKWREAAGETTTAASLVSLPDAVYNQQRQPATETTETPPTRGQQGGPRVSTGVGVSDEQTGISRQAESRELKSRVAGVEDPSAEDGAGSSYEVGESQSPPRNVNKMLLLDFKPDLSTSNIETFNRG